MVIIVDLGKSKRLVQLGKDHANDDKDQGENESQNAEGLEWLIFISAKVSEERIAVRSLGRSEVDKQDDQDVWNELLNQEAPQKWHVANHGLNSVPETDDIPKGKFPPDGSPSSGVILCQPLRKVKCRDKNTATVGYNETNKPRPRCVLTFNTEPECTSNKNTEKIRANICCNRGSAKKLRLMHHSIRPARAECLKESDDDHDKVDVEIHLCYMKDRFICVT